MKAILTILVTVLFLANMPSLSRAGEINQPSHLPNRVMNKINQVRLLGLTAEEDYEALEDDTLNLPGIGTLDQIGCNLNVGNTVGDASRTGGSRDVIINGDVINFCK